ncbi:MAG: hypothetical protein ABTQ31_20300 [Rhizobiaceae bacterium]
MAERYTIKAFMDDAKGILAKDLPLLSKKMEIGDRLSVLSRRDDLLRYAMPAGAADTSPVNYLLWREAPHLALLIAQWDPGYRSPVHEHGDFWVVGCGYRGRDRWDIYERMDDGSKPGYAHVEMIDQVVVDPGVPIWMPAPPRAIHSHNNETERNTLELIFSASAPPDSSDRLIYEVEERRCYPTLWKPSGMFVGDDYPKHLDRTGLQGLSSIRSNVRSWTRRVSCPLCTMIEATRLSSFACTSPA